MAHAAQYPFRHAVTDLKTPDRDVVTSTGQRVEIRNHVGYTSSREEAQEAAGLIGVQGRWVDREEPQLSKLGVQVFLPLARCRACDEGVCRLGGHGDGAESRGATQGFALPHPQGGS